MSTYAGATPQAEASGVLRYAPLFPSDTTGVVSFRLNDAAHEQIRNARLGDTGMTAQWLDELGDEVAVGFSHGANGRTGFSVLASLKEAAALKGRLGGMGLSMLSFETYNGVDVYPVILPDLASYDLHAALPGDTLVVSTDIGHLKTLIDRIQSGKPSPLFSSLIPPLDPAVQRTRLLVFTGAFFSETALSYLKENMDWSTVDERAPWLNHMFDRVRDVRLISTTVNGQEEARLSLQLD
jgi:hypothetical protein